MTEESSHTTEAIEPSAFEPAQQESFINLSENDRERLGEAIQKLLSTGTINGKSSSNLYHWCRQHFTPLKEWAEVIGLDLGMFHEERLIQAIPHVSSLRLKLRKDETIVWLALWYAGDVRWRDEGNDQAFLSVSELNSLIQDQLLPDITGQTAQGRLREILRKAAKFNLIHLNFSEPFEDSGIEVLPAIRRAVPFRHLAEWSELAQDFNQQEVDEPITEETEELEESNPSPDPQS